MTFDCLVVNLQRVFSSGQAYVALSRTRTLQGLILRNYAPGKIQVSAEVVNFYRNLEHKKEIKSNFKSTYNSNSVCIADIKKQSKNTEECKEASSQKVKIEEQPLAKDEINNMVEPPVYKTNFIVNEQSQPDQSNIDNNEHSIYLNKIAIIKKAIKENKSIIIEYQNYEKENSLREIVPLEMFENSDWENDKLYLRAFCKLRQEERHFRLDRIIGIKEI